MAARAARPFDGIADLAERAALDRRDLEALAAADASPASRASASGGMAGDGRGAAAAFAAGGTVAEEGIPLLRAPREGQDIVADYGSTGPDVAPPSVGAVAREAATRGVLPTQGLWEQPNGKR